MEFLHAYDPLPHLRLELIEAKQKNQLVIFVGAGVSRLAGCDSWAGLADRLVRATADKLGGKALSYRSEELLQKLGDNKKIITICRKLLVPATCVGFEMSGIMEHTR